MSRGRKAQPVGRTITGRRFVRKAKSKSYLQIKVKSRIRRFDRNV